MIYKLSVTPGTLRQVVCLFCLSPKQFVCNLLAYFIHDNLFCSLPEDLHLVYSIWGPVFWQTREESPGTDWPDALTSRCPSDKGLQPQMNWMPGGWERCLSTVTWSSKVLFIGPVFLIVQCPKLLGGGFLSQTPGSESLYWQNGVTSAVVSLHQALRNRKCQLSFRTSRSCSHVPVNSFCWQCWCLISMAASNNCFHCQSIRWES